MERFASVVSERRMRRILSLRLPWMVKGISSIETGVPFMTHMLDLFTKHGILI